MVNKLVYGDGKLSERRAMFLFNPCETACREEEGDHA